MKGIVVLLDKLGRLVADGAGKVADEKTFIVANLSMIAQLRFAWKCQPEVVSIGRVNS